MMKRIFSFVILAAVIASCGNSGKKEASAKTGDTSGAVKVEFASLVKNPDEYVGKSIIVEGKVVHVCMETGKKLFIVGENPDISLYIAAGENISKFPMELLGTNVTVEGVITKVGGPALAANESKEGTMKDMKCVGDSATMGGPACETEKNLAGQSSLANIVMEYKSHTVKN
jgi:hypothetical protein